MSKVKLPSDYPFPAHVASRPRDFKLSYFIIKELGVAAIPPTEFFTDDNAHIVEDWLRFAICKNDDVLDKGKGQTQRFEEVHAISAPIPML